MSVKVQSSDGSAIGRVKTIVIPASNVTIDGKVATVDLSGIDSPLDIGTTKLKDDSGTLSVRNSGDSADAPIKASDGTFTGTVAIGGTSLQVSNGKLQIQDSASSGAEDILQPMAGVVQDYHLTPTDTYKISEFDGGIGVEWVKTSGTGTASDETAEVLVGSQSLKIDQVDGNSMNLDYTAALDLSAYKMLRLKLKMDVVSAGTLSVIVYVFNGADFNKRTIGITPANYVYGDWYTIPLEFSSFTEEGGGAVLDWSAVTKIRIRLDTFTGSNTFYLSGLDAQKVNLTKPVIIFNFDDGRVSTFTKAMPKLAQHGWGAVAFVIGSYFGGSGYMTVKQMQILQNEHDWDIGSHSYSHVDFTALTAAQAEAEIRKNLYIMRANGLTSGLNYFAWPYGYRNPTVKAVAERYHPVVRSVRPFTYQTIPILNKSDMAVRALDASVNIATAQGYVDFALAENSVLVFLLHDLVDGAPVGSEWAASDFNTLVDYCASQGVEVLTFSQYLRKYGTQ